MEEYGVDGVIGLKMQGSINKVPWKVACKKKFKNHSDGWEIAMAKTLSEWEARIADQTYHPFLNRDLGGDTWEVSLSVLLLGLQIIKKSLDVLHSSTVSSPKTCW